MKRFSGSAGDMKSWELKKRLLGIAYARLFWYIIEDMQSPWLKLDDTSNLWCKIPTKIVIVNCELITDTQGVILNVYNTK